MFILVFFSGGFCLTDYNHEHDAKDCKGFVLGGYNCMCLFASHDDQHAFGSYLFAASSHRKDRQDKLPATSTTKAMYTSSVAADTSAKLDSVSVLPELPPEGK